jgi:hypothetical protein
MAFWKCGRGHNLHMAEGTADGINLINITSRRYIDAVEIDFSRHIPFAPRLPG